MSHVPQTSCLFPIPVLGPGRGAILYINNNHTTGTSKRAQHKPTAAPRTLTPHLRIHLAHSKLKRGITRPCAGVLELRGGVGAEDGDAELEAPPRGRRPAVVVRQRVREGQVRGEQARLREDRPLVPVDVLVVEPVAADVDDRGEGDAQGLVRWGDAGEAGRLLARGWLGG